MILNPYLFLLLGVLSAVGSVITLCYSQYLKVKINRGLGSIALKTARAVSPDPIQPQSKNWYYFELKDMEGQAIEQPQQATEELPEKHLEPKPYITINGEEPPEPIPFTSTTTFKGLGIVIALIVGFLAYLYIVFVV